MLRLLRALMNRRWKVGFHRDLARAERRGMPLPMSMWDAAQVASDAVLMDLLPASALRRVSQTARQGCRAWLTAADVVALHNAYFDVLAENLAGKWMERQ